MSLLTLVRGIPGSGKSTVARDIVTVTGMTGIITDIWENDMFFIGSDGVYKYDSTKMSRASSWCLAMTAQSLIKDRDVVVANTFFRYIQMVPYIELAAKLNVTLRIIECLGRHQNIHGVPDDMMQIMTDTFEVYSRLDS